MEATGVRGWIPAGTEASIGLWWCIPVLSAPERYRQEGQEFKGSFSYVEGFDRPGPHETLSQK